MKRREFIKTSSKGVALTAIGLSGSSLITSCVSKSSTNKNISAIIPLPIQVVIDDVGWWSGKDGTVNQEPYRTGINRNHVVADYQAIINLGKALGIRPQAATILCEWDRKNILKDVPHSNWMGKNWDNSKWVGSWLEEATDIIKSNQEHFELSLHGLAHEWWEDGKVSRAEWAEEMSGIMCAKDIVEQHLDAFGEILNQNNLGSLFPKSYIPTNFCHTFGVSEGHDISMAQILKNRGFTYINTAYEWRFHGIEKVKHGLFGVDSGVLTVDRGHDLLGWNTIGQKPTGKIKGATCGMHWANILHTNPKQNSEIVDGWVKVLSPYNDKQETMLAKNSLEFQKQLTHHITTKVEVAENEIKLDFNDTNKLGTIVANNEFFVKIKSENELSFSSDNIDIVSVSTKKIEGDNIYKLGLKKGDIPKASITIKT